MHKLLICLIVAGVIGSAPAQAGVYEEILDAANNGKTGEVIGLLRKGLDVNTTDRDGTSLLAIAARTGNLELLGFLLDNHGSLERRNRYGDTPLLLAVSQNHGEVVRRLVKAGANINPAGWTPLHYAIYGNRLDLAQFLVGHGAKLDLRAPTAARHSCWRPSRRSWIRPLAGRFWRRFERKGLRGQISPGYCP